MAGCTWWHETPILLLMRPGLHITVRIETLGFRKLRRGDWADEILGGLYAV
jgi:hypothetical protein